MAQRTRQATVGAVWVSKTNDGKRYLSIKADIPFTVEPGRWELVAFTNEQKGDNENAPDFRLVLSEQQQRNVIGRQADEFDDGPGKADPFA